MCPEKFSYKKQLKYLDDIIATWESLVQRHPGCEDYVKTLADLRKDRAETFAKLLKDASEKRQ